MKNGAVIYSVPSTGTRFVADILQRIYGFERREPADYGAPDPERQFLQLHVLDQPEDVFGGVLSPVWDLPEYANPVVVPLRDPVMAYLTRHDVGDRRDRTEARWENLMAYCKVRHPLLFPVDLMLSTEERAALLRLLELHLDIEPPGLHDVGADAARAELLRSWAPVGSNGRSQAQVEYLRTREFEDYLEWLGPDLKWLRPAMDFYKEATREFLESLPH